MVEFTDMKGQELVDIKESEDKLELFFKNNKYIIQIVDGNFKIIQTSEQEFLNFILFSLL